MTLCQFLSKTVAENCACLLWVDFTKLGRLSNTDLDTFSNMLKKVLGAMPKTAMGFVVAPYLQSAKIQGGLRGDMRQDWGYSVGTGKDPKP